MLWTIIVILLVLWLLGLVGHVGWLPDPPAAGDSSDRASH